MFMLTAVSGANSPGFYQCTGTNIWGQVIGGAYWGQAPIFNAADPKYAGADMCASILNVYSDSAYTSAARAIVDATGFSGSQNCASNMLAITRPTWLKLGEVTLHVTVNQAAGFPAAPLPTPAAPTAASTTTTGGTLNNLVLVKVGYVTAWLPDADNFLGSSPEATFTMNAACSGTPTCTATVNSPTAQVGAYAYNVFQSTTTGTEKLCNVAPIPLGTNYTIKANCSGASMVAANWAFLDTSILSGAGDSTKISLENAAASIDGSGTVDWIFKDLSIVSTLTTQSVNGMMQLGSSQRAENITFSGGGTHLYIAGSMDTAKKTRHYGFTVSAGPVAAITAFAAKWLRIEDTVMSNFTFPVSATLNNGISVNQCTMCIVDGVRSENIDNSTAVNGGSMMTATGDGTAANASSHVIFTNFQCENLINVNCGDFLNFTHDSEMSNGTCRNTNNSAGVGANILGADCFDIFMAANFTLNNVKGNHRGGPGGTCCPTLEIYASTDGTINGGEFSDDQSGEGVRINSSPALNFNGVIASRNQNSGIVTSDGASVVTCNNTTTVVWVSGQPFGPWKPNQQVWIGAGPTAFNIASMTDFHTMVLTTTCGLGASQAFSVYTQDFGVSNTKTDDNGQAGTGTGVRTGQAEGFYISGHSQATIMGGSANDNVPVAGSKHQQYAVRTENSARVRVVGMDMTGNGGGSNCLLDGNNVTGNHTYCDSPKTSVFMWDDNAGEIWYNSGRKVMNANSSALSTQTTIMSWGIGANYNQSFTCVIYYQGAATSATPRFDVTVPASGTYLQYGAHISTNNSTGSPVFTESTTTTSGTNLTAAAVTAATTTFRAEVDGTIANGATAGTVAVQAGAGASTITVQKGSFCNVSGS